MKITVYHNLRVLLEETYVHVFKLMLERTLLNLKSSDTTSDFADYLKKYYIDRKEEWTTCFCKESFVNTNMYVEAFPGVLKYIYFKEKMNKRLDKCIGILMKLARDKGYERLLKLEKGGNCDRIHQIRVCQNKSLKIPQSSS